MIRLFSCIALVSVLAACSTSQPPLENSSAEMATETNTGLQPGKIISEEVSYQSDTVTMNGYIAYSDGSSKKRPGILVLHEWWGHTDYVRQRADMLAELGYVALAVDMYGDGKTAQHPDDAGKFATMVMQNLDQSEARFRQAYKILESHPMVEQGQISAVGYCFGGTLALTLANKGVDFDGVAAFHAGVTLPVPPNEGLQAKVLIQNGADDPFIKAESVTNYEAMMNQLGKPYTYIAFPGVKHAYTNKDATALGAKFNIPLEYNAEADEKSWSNMVDFFSGIYPQ